MKLNFSVFKKGKPIFWIVGAVVLFVIFYLITSRGASSSSGGGITTITPGPSDTAIAANAQMNIAQLQYGSQLQAQVNQNATDIALATIAANSKSAQDAAAADAAKYVAALDANTQATYITAQKEIAQTNAEYSLETARVASETSISQWNTNADILKSQMATNADMFKTATNAQLYSSLATIAPTLKKGKQVRAFDNVLVSLSASNTGMGVAPSPYDPGVLTTH